MTRWKKFYEQQMQDDELRALVEEELEALRIGEKIAHLRQEKGLTQGKLAARAGIAASKISAIENAPHNMEITTLIKIAHAGGKRLRVTFA